MCVILSYMIINETELRNKIVQEAADTSQTAVAKRIGVTKAFISELIAGRRRVSAKIAQAYGYQKKPVKVRVEWQYEKTS